MVGFESIKAKRTFELIADVLKDRIFAGQYRPGDRLPAEREMAEMLAVGRPAVREAYRALELIGIVEVRKGKEGGAFIREPDYRSVTRSLTDLVRLRHVSLADLTEARLMLEKTVAELAMKRVVAGDLVALNGWIDRAIAKLDVGLSAADENIGFHIRLAEISGNPVLVMVLSSIMDLLAVVLRALGSDRKHSREVAEDHHAIVTALKTREFARLWPVMERHIRASNERLTALAKKSKLPFGTEKSVAPHKQVG
ncbi:MAG: FadR family transcriptional regulator [Alphaproteobacteria bacterium]|nr:FadR family transcriptional regulator [Alphaproteobacteria bacterium]